MVYFSFSFGHILCTIWLLLLPSSPSWSTSSSSLLLSLSCDRQSCDLKLQTESVERSGFGFHCGRKFVFSPEHCHQLWSPSCIIYTGWFYGNIFFLGLKRSEQGTDYSVSFSDEVNNTWRFLHPYSLMLSQETSYYYGCCYCLRLVSSLVA